TVDAARAGHRITPGGHAGTGGQHAKNRRNKSEFDHAEVFQWLRFQIPSAADAVLMESPRIRGHKRFDLSDSTPSVLDRRAALCPATPADSFMQLARTLQPS